MTAQQIMDKPPRIHSLDVIRGFAVLGILVMNIQSFSMPEAAYINPIAFGDLTGINYWVWALSHLFFDSKFMAIFSMLFGAGVLIFCENLDQKGFIGLSIHYRRMFWLMLFGMFHAYLIWDGDVLFSYAACGFLISYFRHKSITSLWSIGLGLLAVGWLFTIASQFSLPYMTAEDFQAFHDDWLPSAQLLQEQISTMTGDWQSRFALRAENSFLMQTFGVLIYSLWRVGGCMLIGMALYKQGIFTNEIPTKTLVWSASILMSFGVLIISYGIYFNFEHQWVAEFSEFYGSQFNYIGSILVALGYIYLLAFIVQKDWIPRLTQRLAYVGRMAFTNYLSQSIICTIIFYHFELFGRVERWQQILIVLSIWLIQFVWSKWWLTRYRFGPLEWAWRSLSYWKVP